MRECFERTERLLGDDAMERLWGATVLLVGLGGVGGSALETLVRTGVGKIVAVDADTVSVSNSNRQYLATRETLGRKKTEVARERALSISPDMRLIPVDLFVGAENAETLIDTYHPYLILDAIDTMSAKIALISAAAARGIPYLACASTGNRLDPTRLRITDLSETHTCPICRVLRRELKKKGVEHLAVVWSDEPPMTPRVTPEEHGRHIPASAPFVPPAAGILMARWAVLTLIHEKETL